MIREHSLPCCLPLGVRDLPALSRLDDGSNGLEVLCVEEQCRTIAEQLSNVVS